MFTARLELIPIDLFAQLFEVLADQVGIGDAWWACGFMALGRPSTAHRTDQAEVTYVVREVDPVRRHLHRLCRENWAR